MCIPKFDIDENYLHLIIHSKVAYTMRSECVQVFSTAKTLYVVIHPKVNKVGKFGLVYTSSYHSLNEVNHFFMVHVLNI